MTVVGIIYRASRDWKENVVDVVESAIVDRHDAELVLAVVEVQLVRGSASTVVECKAVKDDERLSSQRVRDE